jgi:hypothetical protein
MELVYWGAGTDLSPLVLAELSNVQVFHFVDTLPHYPHYSGCFGQYIDTHFCEIIRYLAVEHLKWTLESENDQLMVFRRRNRVLYYHINTRADQTMDLLNQADVVWIKGFLPPITRDTVLTAKRHPHVYCPKGSAQMMGLMKGEYTRIGEIGFVGWDASHGLEGIAFERFFDSPGWNAEKEKRKWWLNLAKWMCKTRTRIKNDEDSDEEVVTSSSEDDDEADEADEVDD